MNYDISKKDCFFFITPGFSLCNKEWFLLEGGGNIEALDDYSFAGQLRTVLFSAFSSSVFSFFREPL